MRKVKRKKKQNPGLRTYLWMGTVFLARQCLRPYILIALLLIGGSAGFYYSGYYHKTTESIDAFLINVYGNHQLVLKDVYLEGQKHTSDKDIIDAINIPLGYPMPKINISAIKSRLEQLPWIKYAVVERLYPSTLNIRMIERKPIALWQYDNQIHLIDQEGVIIREQNLAPFSQLIIIVGEDAPNYIEDLRNIIDINQEVRSMISSAIRVSQRRWNIRLRNGIEIKLPEEQPHIAWKHLLKLHKANDMLDTNIQSIDLRIPNKMFVKQGQVS